MITIRPCIERKQYISGVEERYFCEWVVKEDVVAILKHVAETGNRIGPLVLPPGHISYRFHWPNRSYNLYKIFDANGKLLGNCFNLADSLKLSEGEVSWRDLNIDILVIEDGRPEIINGGDRLELQQTWLHIYIEATKQDLMRKYREIIADTDLMLEKHHPDIRVPE